MNNKKLSDIIINEYRSFLNRIYIQLKKYNPFFITFYDDGKNIQNVAFESSYKGGRSSYELILENQQEIEIFKNIKRLYLLKILRLFTKENVGHVFHLKEFESDMIPYYCITRNIFNCNEDHCIKFIISNDKDLLQCCKLKKTAQCTNRYRPSMPKDKAFKVDIFNDYTAILYLYDKFKIGSLTSKYIPLILSIAGDSADKIKGIHGYGYAKTIKLLANNPEIPHDPRLFYNIKNIPEILKNNINEIIHNFKLIDFGEQIIRSNFGIHKYCQIKKYPI